MEISEATKIGDENDSVGMSSRTRRQNGDDIAERYLALRRRATIPRKSPRHGLG
jgi:hypothetical protein